MKLSEAIRLGAMLKPQSKGFRSGDSTCAIGAAVDAIGKLGCGYPQSAAYDQWPELCRPVEACLLPPVPFVVHSLEGGPLLLKHYIWILNDHHKWTREAIADWVATVEPKAQSTDVENIPALDAVACPVTPVGCLTSRES